MIVRKGVEEESLQAIREFGTLSPEELREVLSRRLQEPVDRGRVLRAIHTLTDSRKIYTTVDLRLAPCVTEDFEDSKVGRLISRWGPFAGIMFWLTLTSYFLTWVWFRR